jgi:tetratricopeptide (TPR) repeat protein
MKSSLILGSITALVAFAPAAAAKSPAEIEQIAKSVSVEIITGEGSGVIVHRQGNLYTLVTNRHVLCGSGSCDASRLSTVYRLRTADGRVYQVSKSGIKLLKDSAGNSLDLASVQFRSNRSYQVATVAESNSLKVDDAVYTAGFPAGQGWLFGSGQAKAVVNKRLPGDRGGYTVIYDAETLPGMSGGGAFDKNGRLVAVHGSGDRYTENTQAEVEPSAVVKKEVGSKIGINRGIPVRWVVEGLGRGILVGSRRSISQMGAEKATAARKADEFFIAGFNKLVGADGDFRVEKREAVAQFSRAIALNPRYIIAYFMRAFAKEKLNDSQGALADYNKAISINPKYANAYNNRGNLKNNNQLKDPQGALADYNKAISINPKFALAYNNRGLLKYEKLNDSQGALADYNQALSINPKDVLAYYNRGLLKYKKLNDSQGALADYNKAISINSRFALAYNNRGLLKYEKLNDSQGALADYNQALSINPKNALAYNNRGLLKQEKLNDAQGALVDYNKALSINPKYALAYNNRGNLKNNNQLNDTQGALADYNKAILINPKFALAYYNRGVLKNNKLNDAQGALADYNKAISINPKLAEAYYNRGFLKDEKLNDRQGAIGDLRTAARIFREQGQTQNLQRAIAVLRKLGATEKS